MSPSWMALVIGLWVAVVVLTALVLGLSRRVRQLSETSDAALVHERIDAPIGGPRVGSRIEWWAGSRLAGDSTVAVGARDRIVLFLSFSCPPCHVLGDELHAAREDGFEFIGSELVVVTDELGRDFFHELGPDHVIVQTSGELSRRLGINATPYGVAVDAAGVVRWSGIANSFDDIVSMVAAFGLDAL